MKLLITGALGKDESFFDELRNCGHEIVYAEDERTPLTEQQVEAAEIEGVICNGLFLYNDIAKFTALRWIHLTSVGFDRVPLQYIKDHAITLHNARGVYSIPMAEFAVSGVLQLYKGANYFYQNQARHTWEKKRDLLELFGKTVCIVGCGNVGTECARRFSAFGCTVNGIDLYPTENTAFREIRGLTFLEDALSASDIVVLTLPLSESTEHLMDERRLSVMKQGSVLVNIARGKIVDTAALERALQKNLRGAVLDVFEEEPLAQNSPLWDMKNVIVTPHNSFVGEGNIKRLQKLILEDLYEKL